MSITLKDVEHVANLARLELSAQEKTQLTEQMNAILKYADKLTELNTDDVEPTTHVLPVRNVMREDIVKPSVSVETAMRNAPEEEDGQFKVPAVLE
ncbi:Asp-tRNA(Asn)/Glu-tRNA(Gln) amidotransferase subunit GatC [Paenibacillus nasutitermitis]|uniref:Aspartyl/glutamyl-tRNA(Asn/Gln) amidotransferase subunit C n=1 Tax=Paenibacillus nasutitermitis TaxID=1652958 RepID=A0A917E442_9BACL|nr:Asp-tRNA(Asn)/Glu-tRNA(Gln) amidotransferase subunit GatC [Paenibacillus nasutitermitis]GGE01717.1 aspartyl/glutamyl-tRNA(Asn/Gln) amidotransferase subunit C [Paenibacillus nasutitermitis]